MMEKTHDKFGIAHLNTITKFLEQNFRIIDIVVNDGRIGPTAHLMNPNG